MAMAATVATSSAAPAAAAGGTDNVLSLETITNRFSAPITEEHAFAVIYECMKSLAKVLSAAEAAATFSGKPASFSVKAALHRSPLAVVSGTADIMLRKDGTVHGSTFVETAAAVGESGKLASGMPICHEERNSRVWI